MSTSKLKAETLVTELRYLMHEQGFGLHEPDIGVDITAKLDDPAASYVRVTAGLGNLRDEWLSILNLEQPLDEVSKRLRPAAVAFAHKLLPLERRPSWREMT